jgi:uncharacterized protein (DUF2164 family)
MEDFEAVHRDYLSSFRKFREQILGNSTLCDSNHPVVDAIKTDILFTQGLRTNIVAATMRVKRANLKPLFDAFSYYLCVASLEHDLDETRNWHRWKFARRVADIFATSDEEEVKQAHAVEFLDFVVKELQDRYANVSQEHYKLKAMLLLEPEL